MDDNESIIVDHNYADDIGHGTAVYYLIRNSLRNIDVEIVNVKIFFKDNLLRYDDFVKILEYLYEHEHFDFINISLGVVQCGDVSKMQEICTRLFERGCILVAAYDNEGAVSFPAALDNVIGVDSNLRVDETKYLESGIVDILCKSKFMRVPWNDGKMTLVKGNSFPVPW